MQLSLLLPNTSNAIACISNLFTRAEESAINSAATASNLTTAQGCNTALLPKVDLLCGGNKAEPTLRYNGDLVNQLKIFISSYCKNAEDVATSPALQLVLALAFIVCSICAVTGYLHMTQPQPQPQRQPLLHQAVPAHDQAQPRHPLKI